MPPADYVIQPYRFFSQQRFTTVFTFSPFLISLSLTNNFDYWYAQLNLVSNKMEIHRKCSVYGICAQRDKKERKTPKQRICEEKQNHVAHA
jgi:hypothetical protein